MGSKQYFIFRNVVYQCNVNVDQAPDPQFIFVALIDEALTEEFGIEITIDTDFVTCFIRTEDTSDLIALKKSIFVAIKNDPPFIQAKDKLKLFLRSEINSYLYFKTLVSLS